MILKICKKIVKRFGKYGKNLWKDRVNTEENSDKIGKIWKKIVKWFGKYRRKISWIVKWFGKYGRKQWKDMKNTEETQIE
jgi:hypothetical protein